MLFVTDEILSICNIYGHACNALYFEKNTFYSYDVSSGQSLPKHQNKTKTITLKFLVPDSGTGYSQLVMVNTNRSATLIKNLTN